MSVLEVIVMSRWTIVEKEALKRASHFVCVILVALSSQAQATSCDPCIQAAANGAEFTMVSAINTGVTSVQANEAATKALNSAIQATDTAILATLNLNTQQLLQGLSASTNRVELSVQQTSKAVERMTDHTVKSMVSALKQVRVAEEVDENNKAYSGVLAQPLSVEIGANRAPLLKQGFVQSDQVWRQMADDMNAWSNNTSDADQAGMGVKQAALLTEGEAVWSPVPLVTQSQITTDKSVEMQKLLTMLINPVPLPSASDEQIAFSSEAGEYELERRILNAQLGLVHAVLAKSVADKQPLIPMSDEDWQKGYVMAEPDNNGSVSVMSMLESETIGRLGAEGWYQDVKTKTQAGILREQVAMGSINAALWHRLQQQEEQALVLQSLLLLNTLREGQPHE
ncbi:hypothetical protein Shew_0987 [Shewanella loihica PV-4]|uniref:Uncharacterized protein n=2 Tax=Shewanella TaxID=22 RepID=A3QBL0_SHELP|nr:hypothetical protein Shew_0987 [Shewanella loihica PV-4]